MIRELELHSVSSVFAALTPDGGVDAGSKMALASLLEMMWADEFVDERDARFINDRVHANIQRDGTFSVVPQMKGGVTIWRTPQDRRVAEKYDVPMIKVTGGQRIDLLGIRKEDLSGGVGRSRHAVRVCVRQELPHRARPVWAVIFADTARAIPPPSASRSRSGTRVWPARQDEAGRDRLPANCAEAL